jgi:glycosyltransferase involved in cell wall biosynthesis
MAHRQALTPLPDVPGCDGWPWTAVTPRPSLTALPRISVVTPSYNQGAYLEAAIRSVLLQEYPNLEYIIIDGGSTDDSLAIIERYAPWLAGWSSARDDGPAQAINRGLSQATGDVLAWLNSDDLFAPGALWAAAEAFAARPDANLVYGEGWYIDEAGDPIEPCRFVRRSFNRRYLVNRDPILQPAAFWRRSLWEAAGPLDESLRWVFDWEWFIRAHARGRFHYLPRDLAYYRVQPEALTRTGGLPRQLEHGRVTRRYGAWWHPNHVVQQTRRLDVAARRATDGLPRWLAAPLRAPAALPRLLAEGLLRGMYMR